MLEKIREGSQGGAAKIILGAVILSFALSGIYSYLGSGAQVNAVTVNGEDITRYDLDKALQNEQGRLRQQMGEMFDTLSADANWMASVRQSVLERMIAERLIDQKAKDLGLRVSDEQIKQAIVVMPEFQQDGVFNNDRYQAVLRQVNMTPDQLATMIGRDMVRNQLLRTLLGSEIVTTEQALSLVSLQQQQRDFRYLTIAKADFEAGVAISDEQIQAFYDKNLDRFATAEQVSLEYVELTVEQLMKDVDASEEAIQAYYDGHQNLYQKPERRLAAHILIEGDDDAAKAKADDALARIRGGESFAEVAKTASDDFSADNGGELDWFEQGVMDPEFDQALFGQDKGQVSEVLKTDYGYQIVLTKDVETGAVAPLAEVRADIETAVKSEQAQERFYELQQLLADVSFQIPENLEDAALEVGGEVKSTELFNRFDAPAPFSDPKVLNAAFSDAVVLDNMNSDIIELESGHVLVVRAKDYKPAGTQPLVEVRDQIQAQLVAEEASAQAKVAAEAKLAELKSGSELDGMVAVDAMGRMGSAEVDGQLVQQVFAMAKPAGGSSYAAIQMSSGDYAVVALDKVSAGDADAQLAESLKLRMASMMGQGSYQALVAALRANADISYPVAE
ncbi:peptidyl-prolyl cis-trans isomerase D [Ferrimonas sediminum]|uniref:Periplasmic chaperone PpiD n=1 Tax=Ferrimonas sediminum TaxID=718193 RepID=A0A1G8XYC7_9GAMM|nr:SurA N-terminal domain-containing protein [Ferrimonas sediminum]SDJ95543.1 peptidyl-prolyl cis-trans isomerase D [Ferrimonas sediminum]